MLRFSGFRSKQRQQCYTVHPGLHTCSGIDLDGPGRFKKELIRALKTIYVVGAADLDNLPVSRSELHDLLSKPLLNGIPLLVLGNKFDKPEALTKQALTDQI